MESHKLLPIVLCGGTGSRLWPLSRESFPKQFIVLNEDSNKSLLQNTFNRLNSFDNVDQPIIVCNEEHRFITAEQLREENIIPKSILLEPFGRNTAAAITAAAFKSIEEDYDPILLVLSADHEIKDISKFKNAVNSGISYVNENLLVTFGVRPTGPETRFGYIKASKELNFENLKGERIEKFIEKPNKSLAEKLILDKRYSWNSGMFMFKASVLLKEIERYLPEVFIKCKESLKSNHYDLDFQRLEPNIFKDCPNISIDNGLMEKTDKGIVIPLDARWNDIGGWQAVWENSKKDEFGNSVQGRVLYEESKNCYFRSENSLIVGIDIEDLIVVQTRDAVLVANKNKTEKIKEIVQKLKSNGLIEGKEHKKINRPWGYYISIEEGEKWKVKKIKVNPNSSLSLQMHKHRAEHWVVLNGTAEVEINNKQKTLNENQSTYIPLGCKHRLSNPTNSPLILIEVQSGNYLGEDDIIRFKDNYGRFNEHL